MPLETHSFGSALERIEELENDLARARERLAEVERLAAAAGRDNTELSGKLHRREQELAEVERERDQERKIRIDLAHRAAEEYKLWDQERDALRAERDAAIVKYAGQAEQAEQQRNQEIERTRQAREERDAAKLELRQFLNGYYQATKRVDNALDEYRQDISQEMFEAGQYGWATHIAERITALLAECRTRRGWDQDIAYWKQRCEAMREALTLAHNLIGHANKGAFENGVTDPTGTTDEGEIRALRIYEQMQAALAEQERG